MGLEYPPATAASTEKSASEHRLSGVMVVQSSHAQGDDEKPGYLTARRLTHAYRDAGTGASPRFMAISHTSLRVVIEDLRGGSGLRKYD